jgi:hypothetical protein
MTAVNKLLSVAPMTALSNAADPNPVAPSENDPMRAGCVEGDGAIQAGKTKGGITSLSIGSSHKA